PFRNPHGSGRHSPVPRGRRERARPTGERPPAAGRHRRPRSAAAQASRPGRFPENPWDTSVRNGGRRTPPATSPTPARRSRTRNRSGPLRGAPRPRGNQGRKTPDPRRSSGRETYHPYFRTPAPGQAAYVYPSFTTTPHKSYRITG